MGVTAGAWNTWPDACTNKPPDDNNAGAGLPLVNGGVVVGRAPEVPGSVRSADCGDWPAVRGGYHLGGKKAGYRTYGELGYTGFSAQGLYVPQQGTGYDALMTQRTADGWAAFRQVVQGVTFVGFSGTDLCGRPNAALSNEMAGDGEGSVTVFAASFGEATCYPWVVRNLTFVDTPDYARLRFSRGPTSPEVAFGLCTVVDEDLSLFGGPSDALDDDYKGPALLKSNKRHEWPAEILRDCRAWARQGYPSEGGQGTCLWWLQQYETLWGSFSDASRRGLVEAGFRGSSWEKGECAPLYENEGELGAAANVQLCTGIEYVLLKSNIPTKIVSGSELLYGPVGYISMINAQLGSSTFAASNTVVDIVRDYTDVRSTQMPPMVSFLLLRAFFILSFFSFSFYVDF